MGIDEQRRVVYALFALFAAGMALSLSGYPRLANLPYAIFVIGTLVMTVVSARTLLAKWRGEPGSRRRTRRR